jgi:hypothetical protein
MNKFMKAFSDLPEGEREEAANLFQALADGFDYLDTIDSGRRKLNNENFKRYSRVCELMEIMAKEGYGKVVPTELIPKEKAGYAEINVNCFSFSGESKELFVELVSLSDVFEILPLADGETILVDAKVNNVYEEK